MVLDTRWEDVDSLLQRSERTKTEKFAKAVREIAAQRFDFPSKEFPAYRTHVNVPEVSLGVQIGEEEIVPSIVVVERVNTDLTRLVMTAEVCVQEDVNDGQAKRVWSRIAAVPDQAFYLYVPVGYGLQAKEICKRIGVRPHRFRTWRWTPRGFEINDVS